MHSWHVKVKARIIYYKCDTSNCQCYSNGDHPKRIFDCPIENRGRSFQLPFCKCWIAGFARLNLFTKDRYFNSDHDLERRNAELKGLKAIFPTLVLSQA